MNYQVMITDSISRGFKLLGGPTNVSLVARIIAWFQSPMISVLALYMMFVVLLHYLALLC